MEQIYYVILNKGGASAQEQSKTEEMWIHIKKSVKINSSILKPYLITAEEKRRLCEYKVNRQIEFFQNGQSLFK